MRSALYQGIVTHHRKLPRAHQFCYDTFMVYLHLDELDAFFSLSPLWSLERANWASFRRQDYLRPDIPDLRDAVREEIHQQTGIHFTGDIAMLTHVRYLGYCFNPVTFYYCQHQDQLHFIVAEVNNTPWNERHCYVLCCDGTTITQRFNTPKQFHVSPFMPMTMHYDWRFSVPGEQLSVSLRNMKDGQQHFCANLNLVRQEATRTHLHQLLLRFPSVTLKTVTGIYWQALQLWLKRTPVYGNPSTQED